MFIVFHVTNADGYMIVDCGRTLMCDVWLIFTSLSTNQHCSHSDHHRCFKNCTVKKISSKNIVKYFHSSLDSSTLIHFASVKIPPKFLVTMKIISTIVLLLLLPCYHHQMLLIFLSSLSQSLVTTMLAHNLLIFSVTCWVSLTGAEPGIESLAEAGTIIAEKSAGYVVDLLCGCGCR